MLNHGSKKLKVLMQDLPKNEGKYSRFSFQGFKPRNIFIASTILSKLQFAFSLAIQQFSFAAQSISQPKSQTFRWLVQQNNKK